MMDKEITENIATTLFNTLEEENITIKSARKLLRLILSKKPAKDNIEKIEIFQNNVLKRINFSAEKAGEILLPFADPTFDKTFKSVFGMEHQKEILISFLNSLLEFSGDNLITSISILSEEMLNESLSSLGQSGISSYVDVHCVTNTGKHIAIEMQRKKTDYFLARTQHYMGRLISCQASSKSSSTYHKEIQDTYILVINRQNLFTGDHKLLDDKLYEIDSQMVVKQTNEPLPQNKMNLKFFELTKFKHHDDFKNLSKDSSLKLQWLEFLICCGDNFEVPDRHELIKNSYKLMEMAQWNNVKQGEYWIKEHDAYYDKLERQQENKHYFEQGEIKGEKKEKTKGIMRSIKREIKLIKKLNIKGSTLDDIEDLVTFLRKKRPNESDLTYCDHIIKNPNDSEDKIIKDLDLENCDFSDESDAS